MASKGPLGGSDTPPNNAVPFNDPALRITGFIIWSGDYVDAIQLHYVDKNTGAQLSAPSVPPYRYGGGGGTPATINFGSNENLTAINIHAGRWIDSLTFFTSTGGNYSFGGSGGSNVGTLSVDGPNQTIYDLGIGYGNYLNNLTIYYQ